MLTKRLWADSFYVSYYCPGCEIMHRVSIFDYNIDYNSVSITPVIKISDGRKVVCEHMIQNGQITWLKHSDKSLEGKTTEVPRIKLNKNGTYSMA